METLILNRYLEVSFEKETSQIKLKWFSESRQMSNQDYQEILSRTAHFVKKYNVLRWLGDTKDFDFPITPKLQHWTTKDFFKDLQDSKLKKMALIIPTEYIANLAVQQTVEEMQLVQLNSGFEIHYFDNTEEAQKWLNF